MPIYAYKCSACQHELDVLQKVSDAPLTICPACGASALAKQLTAAGFQLKGTGWYATDFKNGSAKTDAKPKEEKPASPDGATAGADKDKPASQEKAAAQEKPASKEPAPSAQSPAPATSGD